jgi:hypothetical protein
MNASASRGAAALLIATALLGAGSASGAPTTPTLALWGLNPVRVHGSHFRAAETVTVSLMGPAVVSRTAHANRRGTFDVSLPARVPRCGSVTVRATGRQGSRATLELVRGNSRCP